ncbi:MAG TPA: branched-chain amino acid ABC transporter permease [Ktedonobacterales bacterium]|jgi:branched-chain amino acid transport system permease protein|nr:branched-chain amino acid ABC transporter permease [Ktedonobacterales bacterium]
MSLVLQGIVTGILTGGVYALMAAGLTLIFGVMDIINIAQGAFVILGAYLSYALATHFHVDLFLGLFITIPVMFVLGVILEWTLIRPLKRDRTQLSILVTYAVAIITEGLLYFFFSADTVKLFAWYTTQSVHVFSFYLPDIYLMAFGLSVLLLGALYFLLYRTKFGRSVRAMMQNRAAALLIGIDVERVAALTFGVGVALTAAGGMAYGATTAFTPNSHYDLISRLLVIIIFAGMGSLGGALIASVGMLVIENLTTLLWSPTWASTVFYVLLVLILIVRPQGLFGKASARTQ